MISTWKVEVIPLNYIRFILRKKKEIYFYDTIFETRFRTKETRTLKNIILNKLLYLHFFVLFFFILTVLFLNLL